MFSYLLYRKMFVDNAIFRVHDLSTEYARVHSRWSSGHVEG